MFVNAHTHLYSGLAPFGMPAPDMPPRNFVEILERIWWRLDRALDERSLRAAARYYVAAARNAGTAVLVDHHESPGLIEQSLDVLADACAEFGMAAALCYGATERNGGRVEAERGLAECRRFVRGNRRPGVIGLVGLHASFTVSDETIRDAGNLCRELGVPLHVHLAEDGADVRDARQRGFAGPLERLIALGALVPGSILAHGVHLTADQVKRASDAGCWFVQNPRSNANNRVGYPRGLVASDRVALGTDGFASDMLAEARALEQETVREGDAEAAAAARLEAGWNLVEELFGERAPAAPGRQRSTLTPRPVTAVPATVIQQLEAEARTEAARLWQRW